MKESKKVKWSRTCYNCKFRWKDCKNRFRVETCDKFKFDATSKSI